MSKKTFSGRLVSGTGKGAYFIKLYSKLLEQKLGFKPFPGTFNLQVQQIPSLDEAKKIILNKENYGQVDCYPVLIHNSKASTELIHNNFKGYLLRPHKTTHPAEILEIITAVNLRKALSVNDGDEIQCELV